MTRTKLDTDWDETVNAAERNGDVELAFKAREIAAGLSDLQRVALVRACDQGGVIATDILGDALQGLRRMKLVELDRMSLCATPLGRAVAAVLEEK